MIVNHFLNLPFCCFYLSLTLSNVIWCPSVLGQESEPDQSTVQKAVAGDAKSQYSLACNYLEKVPQDATIGMKWLHESARQGFGPALGDLGLKYFYGDLVKQDKSLAVELWEKAAAKAHNPSRCNLAFCYMQGTHTEPSIERALGLLNDAAKSNHPRSCHSLH